MARRGNLRFDKRSIRKFEDRMEAVIHALVFEGENMLSEFGEEAMRMSAEEVPQDTTALLQSAYVEEPEYNEDTGKLSIDIGYGGKKDTLNPETLKMASEYAYEVHEDLNVFHPAGKAKYLEDPINALQSKFSNRLKEWATAAFAAVKRM